MKNILFAAIFAACSLSGSLAQAQYVSEGPRPYAKKEERNSLSVQVSGTAKNVQAVLDERFEKQTGLKPKTANGLRVFGDARYLEIAPASLYFYYRVEQMSKENAGQCRVDLFVSGSDGVFFTSQDHPEEMRRLTELLEGLQSEVRIYEKKLAVADQKKVLDKAVTEHNKMIKDSVELEAKLAETLKAIEQNKINRANQRVVISDEERRLLEQEQELAVMKSQFQSEVAARRARAMDPTARKPETPAAPEAPKPADSGEPKKP